MAACNAITKNDGTIIAVISFVLAIAAWPRVAAYRRAAAERAHSAAKAEWEGVLERWKHEASAESFVERLKALQNARIELADLANERRRRIAKLEGERETRQRQRYLGTYRPGVVWCVKINEDREGPVIRSRLDRFVIQNDEVFPNCIKLFSRARLMDGSLSVLALCLNRELTPGVG